MDFLTVFPQFCEIRDTSQKEVILTILNVQSTGTLGKFQSTNQILFPLVIESTLYSSVLIIFDLQIYNFLTKINTNSTDQNAGFKKMSAGINIPPRIGLAWYS